MKLAEKDVRAIVHLVGEVLPLSGGSLEKKRFLMQRLCKLVDADAWAWGLSCQPDPLKSQVHISIMHGGFTDETYVKYLQAVEHPDMIALTSRFYQEIEEKREHLTRLRDQIIDDASFVNSNAYAAWKEADIGPLILSQRPLDDNSASTVGIYRRHNRQNFSMRESRMVHIVLSEVPWLHEQGWPEDRGYTVPVLSKRQRLTLNLLSLGKSRKEIADKMNISVHTVQGYIKHIYRYFGVNSQAKLMNRFYQGNGRDN